MSVLLDTALLVAAELHTRSDTNRAHVAIGPMLAPTPGLEKLRALPAFLTVPERLRLG